MNSLTCGNLFVFLCLSREKTGRNGSRGGGQGTPRACPQVSRERKNKKKQQKIDERAERSCPFAFFRRHLLCVLRREYRIHARTRTPTRARTLIRTRTRTSIRAHAHLHAHAHAHTHAHAHAHVPMFFCCCPNLYPADPAPKSRPNNITPSFSKQKKIPTATPPPPPIPRTVSSYPVGLAVISTSGLIA